jgi:hypothetical protein
VIIHRIEDVQRTFGKRRSNFQNQLYLLMEEVPAKVGLIK